MEEGRRKGGGRGGGREEGRREESQNKEEVNQGRKEVRVNKSCNEHIRGRGTLTTYWLSFLLQKSLLFGRHPATKT